MKIIIFIITALIQLAAATFGFFALILGLNGFNEEDATPSIYFFIALSMISALGLGATSAFTAKRIAEKKSLGKFGASAISVVSFAVIGGIILMVGWFAALFLAVIMHEWK
ncbi:MAG: hypothetical protein LC768_14180 [Acidobacteria bacterium]|nr:hypothetical protein [Acidobacteriota bacterium]MCA1639461.1 hypothetical protein [Acidobacteriota bacterium]